MSTTVEHYARCRHCSEQIPDEFAKAGVACPKCHTRSYTYGVNITEHIRISTSWESELSPGQQKNSRIRWQLLKDGISDLVAQRINPLTSDQLIADAHRLTTFFVEMYNLKDALIAEAQALGLTKQQIEDRVTNDPRLALIADLANTEKHIKLNKPPRSKHHPIIQQPKGRQGGNSPCWQFKLPIKHGSNMLEGVEVAKDGLQAWEDALKSWGLI